MSQGGRMSRAPNLTQVLVQQLAGRYSHASGRAGGVHEAVLAAPGHRVTPDAVLDEARLHLECAYDLLQMLRPKMHSADTISRGELKQALLKHGQDNTQDSIFDFAQKIQAVLDMIVEHSHLPETVE